MFDQCWPTVYDVGPTLVKHWVDASCLLFYYSDSPRVITLDVSLGKLNPSVELHQHHTNTVTMVISI